MEAGLERQDSARSGDLLEALVAAYAYLGRRLWQPRQHSPDPKAARVDRAL